MLEFWEDPLKNKLRQCSLVWKRPGESYRDSKQANLTGVYTKKVDEMFTNYVHPQENGNRADTNWASLVNRHGIGFMAVRYNSTFNLGASYFEVTDLEKVKHTIDFQKRNYILLKLDHKQNCLGSNSCGQYQLEMYRCKFEAFEFKFKLSVYSQKEISDIAKTREEWTEK